MDAKIDILRVKDTNGSEYAVYPKTLIKCITNENGDNLENTLKEFIKDNASEIVGDEVASKTYVAEQIAGASHLVREIVTEIPTAETAEDNVIYMLKVDSASGNDMYQEYQLINGEVVMVGDTSVDLSGYAKSEELDNYFKNTGGNISGNVNLTSPDADTRAITFINSLRNVSVDLDYTGKMELYDNTANKAILESYANGVNKFYGTADEAIKSTFDGNDNNIAETYLPKTATATDSAMLGGKSASEYVQGSNIKIITNYPSGITYESTMKELIDALPDNSIFMQNAHAPIVPKDYCALLVFRYNANYAFAYAFCQLNDHEYIGRLNGSADWSGWTENATIADLANYLPLSGGKLQRSGSTPLTLESIDGTMSLVNFFGMGELLGFLGFSGKDRPVFFHSDGTNADELIHTSNVGNYALPLSGGIVGNANTSPLQVNNTTGIGGTVYMAYRVASQLYGLIGMGGLNTPVFQDTNGANHTLLHTGNKPTGTYTGNGSSAERIIYTGGKGGIAVVVGNGATTIITDTISFSVTPTGLTPYSGATHYYSSDTGMIALFTDSPTINASGVTYTWRIL